MKPCLVPATIKRYSVITASLIEAQWRELAIELDHTISTDAIQINFNTVFDKASAFLESWMQKNYPNASVDDLIRALIKIKRLDIVEKIRQQQGMIYDQYSNVATICYVGINTRINLEVPMLTFLSFIQAKIIILITSLSVIKGRCYHSLKISSQTI